MNPVIIKKKVQKIPVLEVVLQEYREKKLPAIIYYHGWQTSKELVLTQGRKLAKAGFRVLLPDAANHGERYLPVSSIPSLTFWDSIYHNLFEFHVLVDHLKQKEVWNGQLGVGGVSMGGMTTCALLTQHDEILWAACIMGSPSLRAYRQMIASHAKNVPHFPKDYTQLLSWIDAYDLANQPERLKGRPLFFWHGKKDERINYSDTSSFVFENQSQQHGKNIQFVSSEVGRHLIDLSVMDQVTDFYKNQRTRKN